MFCILLKKKLEIEAKVSKLQAKYLNSKKIYNQPAEEEEEASRERKQELEQKSQVLANIIKEYKESLGQFQELSDLILSARELAFSIESELDFVASKLNIEYPPELIRREQSEEREQESFEATGEEQGENLATEEDLESDKENNESSLNQSNDEYYSPIIQIRKSTTDNREAYTPALKSSSKLPIRRRI